ncbi:hypothetical protein M0R45_006029 [Rubus argutus]|uniref:F-box domain-containing protein n=1 Tax=Rubus argutus TaxID=59490 RepID=A0AAW1YPU5_RUBAR
MPRKQSSKTRVMDLPVEILLDILRRLPVKSVCCLRCVSKTLSDIVLTPFFVDLHTRFLISTNGAAEAAPQLVLRHVTLYRERSHRRLTALESLNYDGGQGKLSLSETLSTSCREGYNVHFVFYNLICFKSRSPLFRPNKCFLINPVSREVLRIPTPDQFGKNMMLVGQFGDCYGMGFDDITNTYKIVCVSEICNITSTEITCRRVVVKLLVLGTSSWREMPIPSVLSRGTLYRTKSVCAHGDMHWLFDEEGDIHIVSFDFKKEEFYLTPIPATSQMPYLHLITLRESIAIVDTLSAVNIEIWVMKDYNLKQWKREYIINLQMLGSNVEFKFHMANCGEWEHGILFIDEEGETSLFWDLSLVSFLMKQLLFLLAVWVLMVMGQVGDGYDSEVVKEGIQGSVMTCPPLYTHIDSKFISSPCSICTVHRWPSPAANPHLCSAQPPHHCSLIPPRPCSTPPSSSFAAPVCPRRSLTSRDLTCCAHDLTITTAAQSSGGARRNE